MPLKHTRQDALEYHRAGRPGKIEVRPTKPCLTQLDLSLAYSPGVAEPCREIAKDAEKVYEYTAKGNLIAVVTDGSAVLGLGDIGPLAGKPVMEGKAVLFKRFADIDVFDIELGTKDVEEIICAVKAIAPTVAGINLEDISAPRCFEIERRLREELDIPVFHDDQHGTAVIAGAGLINALEVAGKKIEEVRMVVSGAGASAVACTEFAIGLGLKREHVILCDTKGVVWKGRVEGMNEYKERLAADTPHRTLSEAIRGADVFLGLSAGNAMQPEMLLAMAENPIVFAMANPDPEILPELAKATRADVIIATGRSDYPNQVNNVLGFPFIFRGALDVRARTINKEMLAAAHALAELAREPVPENVAAAYGLKSEDLAFGRESLIPKPLDHRVIRRVATAVARAAIETGVARKIVDLEEYVRTLGERIGEERDLMRMAVSHARRDPRRIVYPEGDAERILIAAEAVVKERIAKPVLVGEETLIRSKAAEYGISLEGIEIADPASSPKLAQYANELHELRRHRRVDAETALRLMRDPLWFGPMMLRMGDADGLVCGVRRQVRKTMTPMLKTIPLRPDAQLACGMTMVFTSHGTVFLSDTSVNINPTDRELAEIALLSAEQVREFGIEPVVAMLSFSSFGGTPHPQSDLVRRAVRIAREEAPHLIIDGEMRVDCALDPTVQQRYPDCILKGRRANVLVFPNLESANIGFNLVRLLADLPVVGPLMLGLSKPAHMLQPHSCGVRDVVHLTAIACLQAQGRGGRSAMALRAALGNTAALEIQATE
ncbi:MAG: NADP-dependent malic enzyme [Planctomycetota bacterium]|nr:NADP-dependent malic enzyme [Planctomycetota bacterium]